MYTTIEKCKHIYIYKKHPQKFNECGVCAKYKQHTHLCKTESSGLVNIENLE